MERRAVLKLVALTALSKKLNALPCAGMGPMEAAPAAPAYTLQFFSQEESGVLDQLMEIIIPADEHSPGAHVAQTNFFADLMVATSNEENDQEAMAKRNSPDARASQSLMVAELL